MSFSCVNVGFHTSTGTGQFVVWHTLPVCLLSNLLPGMPRASASACQKQYDHKVMDAVHEFISLTDRL